VVMQRLTRTACTAAQCALMASVTCAHAGEAANRSRPPGSAASLAAHNTPVTAAERDELLALLEAMDMPTDPISKLNVQG